MKYIYILLAACLVCIATCQQKLTVFKDEFDTYREYSTDDTYGAIPGVEHLQYIHALSSHLNPQCGGNDTTFYGYYANPAGFDMPVSLNFTEGVNASIAMKNWPLTGDSASYQVAFWVYNGGYIADVYLMHQGGLYIDIYARFYSYGPVSSPIPLGSFNSTQQYLGSFNGDTEKARTITLSVEVIKIGGYDKYTMQVCLVGLYCYTPITPIYETEPNIYNFLPSQSYNAIGPMVMPSSQVVENSVCLDEFSIIQNMPKCDLYGSGELCDSLLGCKTLNQCVINGTVKWLDIDDTCGLRHGTDMTACDADSECKYEGPWCRSIREVYKCNHDDESSCIAQSYCSWNEFNYCEQKQCSNMNETECGTIPWCSYEGACNDYQCAFLEQGCLADSHCEFWYGTCRYNCSTLDATPAACLSEPSCGTYYGCVSDDYGCGIFNKSTKEECMNMGSACDMDTSEEPPYCQPTWERYDAPEGSDEGGMCPLCDYYPTSPCNVDTGKCRDSGKDGPSYECLVDAEKYCCLDQATACGDPGCVMVGAMLSCGIGINFTCTGTERPMSPCDCPCDWENLPDKVDDVLVGYVY